MHKITFYQHKQPALPDGLYTVNVNHTLEHKGHENKNIPKTASAKTTQDVYISGERFSLQPTEILGVYPPAGVLGDFSHVLPNVQLSRDTLPWEREGKAGNDDSPWVALLLFTEDEAPIVKNLTVDDLQKAGQGYPTFQLEPGQLPADHVQVIDVQKKWIQQFMPSLATLKLLCHVRYEAEGKKAGDNTGGLASILANRLPAALKTHVAFLVSVEDRYGKNDQFDLDKGGKGDTVRLVVLKTWRFTCADDAHNLPLLLKKLNNEEMKVPEAEVPPLLQESFLYGAVPLPWYIRNGKKGVAWYRGPLGYGDFPLQSQNFFDRHSADAYMVFNLNSKVWDATYAAAWELGRKLAFKQQAFALTLFRWKRLMAKQNKTKSIGYELPYTAKIATDFPLECFDWLQKLSSLKDIPLGYLVPDEQLLPLESIRFVKLDVYWLRALVMGALSLGNIDPLLDREISGACAQMIVNHQKPISGCILRSQIIKNFPSLVVEALGSNGEVLPLVMQKNYTPGIGIYLFEGEFKEISFLQKGEALHYGFEVEIGTNGQEQYFASIWEQSREASRKIPVELSDGRIVDMIKLGQSLDSTPNSAHLGFILTQANSGIRFEKSEKSPTA